MVVSDSGGLLGLGHWRCSQGHLAGYLVNLVAHLFILPGSEEDVLSAPASLLLVDAWLVQVFGQVFIF